MRKKKDLKTNKTPKISFESIIKSVQKAFRFDNIIN